MSKKTAAAVTPFRERNDRKTREGIVTSDKMDQTVIVTISTTVKHRRYHKYLERTSKLHVHNPDNDAKVGDRVVMMETRPLSKMKRWRVCEIVERAK